MNTETEITIDPRLEGVELREGPGDALKENAKLCAMQWVAKLSGLSPDQISDSPDCACRVLGPVIIKLNDRWSAANRQKLRAVIPAMIDSRVARPVEIKRAYFMADFALRTVLPWMCAKLGFAAEGEPLRALGTVSDRASAELARQAARSLREFFLGKRAAAAYDAYDAAAAYAAAADAAAAAYDGAAAAYDAYDAYDGAADAYDAYDAAAAAAAAAAYDGAAAADARSELADMVIKAIRSALEIRQ